MKNNILEDLNATIDSIIDKYIIAFKQSELDIEEFLKSTKSKINEDFANAMTHSTHLAVQNGNSMDDDFSKNLLKSKEKGIIKYLKRLNEVNK